MSWNLASNGLHCLRSNSTTVNTMSATPVSEFSNFSTSTITLNFTSSPSDTADHVITLVFNDNSPTDASWAMYNLAGKSLNADEKPFAFSIATYAGEVSGSSPAAPFSDFEIDEDTLTIHYPGGTTLPQYVYIQMFLWSQDAKPDMVEVTVNAESNCIVSIEEKNMDDKKVISWSPTWSA